MLHAQVLQRAEHAHTQDTEGSGQVKNATMPSAACTRLPEQSVTIVGSLAIIKLWISTAQFPPYVPLSTRATPIRRALIIRTSPHKGRTAKRLRRTNSRILAPRPGKLTLVSCGLTPPVSFDGSRRAHPNPKAKIPFVHPCPGWSTSPSRALRPETRSRRQI
jgi:hypothetical protein